MGTQSQGAWLKALGIDTRTEALALRTPHLRNELLTARDRLVADDQMGHLFKVMGLAAPGWPRGVGFESEDQVQ